MKNAITASLAIAATLAFMGAARSASTGHSPAADSSKPVIVMIGDDMKFSPAKITIHRGQTVAWQNTSHMIHNVVDDPSQSPKPGIMTLPKGAASFDSGLVNYGQTYVQTFNTPGTYKYACTLHIANGMLGQITVK